MQGKAIWGGAISITVLALVAGFMYFTSKPGLRGAVIEPPLPAAEVHLTDFNGHPFTLNGLHGKVVVLYFGYTNCTTECPLTMAHLKLATDALGDKVADVRIVMVSTDPARDTPQAMKDFLGKFSPNFIGLVGAPRELAQVWKEYGVSVEDGGQTHSYLVYLIDRAGNFRETFLPDSLPADEAADMLVLLRE